MLNSVSQWIPNMNTNNETSVIDLMISMQSNKQTNFHITLISCVAVEYFTYLASELSIFVGEMLHTLGIIDVFLNNFQQQHLFGYKTCSYKN